MQAKSFVEQIFYQKSVETKIIVRTKTMHANSYHTQQVWKTFPSNLLQYHEQLTPSDRCRDFHLNIQMTEMNDIKYGQRGL